MKKQIVNYETLIKITNDKIVVTVKSVVSRVKNSCAPIFIRLSSLKILKV